MAEREFVPPPIHGRPGFREHIDPLAFPAEGMSPDEAYELLHTGLMLDGRRDAEPRVVRHDLDGAAGRAAHPRHASARTTSTTRSTRRRRSSRRPACTCWATSSTRRTPREVVGRRARSAPPRRSCSACWRTSAAGGTGVRPPGCPPTRPNVVFGAETHVVWDKFANYFDVEMRKIPMKPDRYVLSADDVERAHRREHDRRRRGARHDAHRRGRPDRGDQRPARAGQGREGLGHPAARRRRQRRVHRAVRRARLRAGTSGSSRSRRSTRPGHKYGLVYPGVGWLIFRDASKLPEDLVFSVNYLGGAQPTYTFNFSRGLGDDPGADVQLPAARPQRATRRSSTTMLANARHLNESLEATRPVRDPQPRARRAGGHVHAQGRPRLRRLPPVGAAAGERLDRARPTACRPTPRTCTCCASWCGST